MDVESHHVGSQNYPQDFKFQSKELNRRYNSQERGRPGSHQRCCTLQACVTQPTQHTLTPRTRTQLATATAVRNADVHVSVHVHFTPWGQILYRTPTQISIFQLQEWKMFLIKVTCRDKKIQNGKEKTIYFSFQDGQFVLCPAG